MKCGICGQELESSDALEAHNEQMHPAGTTELESPDLLGDTPEESAAVETPLATH